MRPHIEKALAHIMVMRVVGHDLGCTIMMMDDVECWYVLWDIGW